MSNRAQKRQRWAVVVPAVLVSAALCVSPASTLAQADEQREAVHLYGAFVQMGSVHGAAFRDDKPGMMQALIYLIGAARASKCIDPEPWVQILNELQRGASARSMFSRVTVLTDFPGAKVLEQVNKYRCRCEDSSPPPTGNLSGNWRLTEGYCAPGEMLTITQVSGQIVSIRSKGYCSGGEYAEYEATNIQWQPDGRLTYRAVYTVRPPSWPEPYAEVSWRFTSGDKAVGDWRKNGKSGGVVMERMR